MRKPFLGYFLKQISMQNEDCIYVVEVGCEMDKINIFMWRWG